MSAEWRPSGVLLHGVTLKTLRDQRLSLLAWMANLALLVGMYVAVWPSVRDQPSMNDLLDQMPEAFRVMLATTGADMSTPEGFMQIELFSFMGPMLLMIYTVGAGAAAVAGEEERHTLDLLLSNPIGRARLIVEKAVTMTVATALLGAVTGVSLVAEGQLVDLDLDSGNVAATILHLCLLALVFGALALALGAATGKVGLSRSVPAIAATGAYVVHALAPVVSWLEPFQRLSPFHQYIGHDPLRAGVSWPSAGIAVATILVLIALAVAAFQRRDVAT